MPQKGVETGLSASLASSRLQIFCAAFCIMANISRTTFNTGAADKNTIPLSHTSKTLIFICAQISTAWVVCIWP